MKDRIKTIRKEAGLTQQQLADLFGVKRNTVAQWETGANALTNQTIEQYVKAFNINREWLENGIGKMHHTQTDEEKAGAILGDVTNQSPDSDKFEMYELLSKIDDPELIYELKIIADAIVRISKKTTH